MGFDSVVKGVGFAGWHHSGEKAAVEFFGILATRVKLVILSAAKDLCILLAASNTYPQHEICLET